MGDIPDDAAADLAAFGIVPGDPALPEPAQAPLYARARARSEQLLRQGAVAAFTVAGGQGSRLGFDGPKGCYPGGAVTNKPLFACLADWIIAAQERFGPAPGTRASILWYIMTSPGNHAAIERWRREQGLRRTRERRPELLGEAGGGGSESESEDDLRLSLLAAATGNT